MPVRTPDSASHDATERASHSVARGALHGASSGTLRAIRSSFHCASASVTTASGLIFGINPV